MKTTEDNKSQLEEILNVDSVLKAIAVNTVLGNYDSYSGSKAHNYYLLYEDGKFSYIGWDYNMSIGGFMEGNGASVTADIDSPVYNVDISQRPLIEKLLKIDEYNDRYKEYVNELTEYFSECEEKINSIADTIRPYVENDPSAFYTIDQFETNITKSDADLSEVSENQKNNKPSMMGPDNGAISSDGVNNTNEGPGFQKPESTENTEIGNKPQIPEGTENQDVGERPQMPDGQGAAMGGMGGKINGDAVSIVDYITQRIANIKLQMQN